MKRRRLGCMMFGTAWAVLMLLTGFGLALAHPPDDEAKNALEILFWIEVAVFVLCAGLFIRGELKNPEV